jgi:hypothetical protein
MLQSNISTYFNDFLDINYSIAYPDKYKVLNIVNTDKKTKQVITETITRLDLNSVPVKTTITPCINRKNNKIGIIITLYYKNLEDLPAVNKCVNELLDAYKSSNVRYDLKLIEPEQYNILRTRKHRKRDGKV